MLFNSYFFIFVFLPIVLIVFYSLTNKSLSIVWLICASFFFYSCWNYHYLILLIFSIMFNYSNGFLLIKSKNNKILYQKLILFFGVLVNLGILGYFKYFNFFIDNANLFFESGFHRREIILPLAISFYTFQQIAYLVDTFRSESCQISFLYYCLFISFFPQLIAGPIVRHNETIPQFKNNGFSKFTYSNISVGLTLFAIGLFKKVILADGIAPYATSVFNAASRGETIFLIESWIGALSYTFQLYFDFSGYSDMAIGLGRMFNISLPLNFYSPYRCSSIIDFWRQWHITLSFFLRDYLYIPLGGNRNGHVMRFLNVMITMLLGGLWHGAGWTFIVWGGLHGIFLSINQFWRIIINKYSVSWGKYRFFVHTFYFCLTFLAITVAWVFFRSENLFAAKNILYGMIGLNGVNLPPGYYGIFGQLSETLSYSGVVFQSEVLPSYVNIFVWILSLSVITWCFPNTYELMFNYDPVLKIKKSLRIIKKNHHFPLTWQPSIFWAMLISILFSICILFMSSASEFLYFNF